MADDRSPDKLSIFERSADRVFSLLEHYTLRLLVLYLLIEKAVRIAFSDGG